MNEPMRISEEDLVLYHYGDHPSPAAVEDALAKDAELRARLERLRTVLAAATTAIGPVPEPDAGFEGRLWRALRSRLSPAVSTSRPLVKWALAAGLAGLLAGAFLLGRLGRTPSPVAPSPLASGSALPTQAQERILRAAVARHLERVERLFVDLEHGRVVGAAAQGTSDEGQLRELLQDNRLYRSALAPAEDARLARFLDEIEPLLAEVAHAPASQVESSQWRERLRERDFLFKLRVVLRRLHGEPERPVAPRALL